MAAGGPGPFGCLLQRQRLAAGLSQEELAERAGLSRRGISDLERGVRRSPLPATARRLAEALELAAPDRAALLGAARASSRPPAAVPSDPPATPRGLAPAIPTPLTSLLGRGQDLEEVQARLATTRLLTLTGAGGIGKTRLALEVARCLAAADTPVGWVDLAPLTDPSLVPQVVASSLGIREQHGQALVETLVDALRSRCLLLVVDNCEHLVHACAVLFRRLLRACPELRVLATSREGLRVAGEVTWVVPPLAYLAPHHATLADLGQVPAAALFVERARARRPDFALGEHTAGAIGDIVQRLEGRPLAIELAAAWVAVLTPDQIAARLDDALRLLVGGERTEPRHATLRATLDWSCALLDAPEQRLFRRLAVFAGSFDLEAAEAVCAPVDGPRQDVLELLAGLVNKSLVVAEPPAEAGTRYHLPEAVRQYARERLVDCDELRPLQLQHAAYFVGLAEAAEPQLVWASRPDVWRCIERDYANIGAALATTLHGDQAELGLRLAGALGRFWWVHGPLSEARRWLEELLSVGSSVSARVRAKALVWLGTPLQATGNDASGAVRLREGLAVANACGDAHSAALALHSLGAGAMQEPDYPLATELLEQCLALRRALGDQPGVAHTLNALGHVARHQRDYDGAAALFEESLALRRRLGSQEGIAQSLESLALLARQQADYARALALHRESFRVLHELGIVRGLLFGLIWQTGVLAATGEHQRAARLLGGVSAISQAIGFLPPAHSRADQAATIDAVCASLGRPAFDAAWAESERLSLDELVAYALEA